MEDHKVKVTVLESECPKYRPGDVISFEGAFVNKDKSDALCMVALNAIYPFVYAARRGGSVKDGPVSMPGLFGMREISSRMFRLICT